MGHTFTSLCRLQGEVDELELVDLICKLLNEDLVEGQTLLLASLVLEVLDQFVGQLVPQLALP